MTTNPLEDNQFLEKLNSAHEREVFAKIISLDFEENPIEEITGSVTQGSINIDGSSAIRRTCSVTIVAQELNINDYYWGLNTKIQIYIGLRNNIDSKYPEIIWFPQGVFLLTTFNTSQSLTGWNISIQGKDKMSLLNGDIGGVITANSVDFGVLKKYIKDENGKDILIKEKYLLKDIITEAVHEYAKEPYHNIIVNDLDDLGLELMEYRGDTDMFMLYDLEINEVTNFTFNPAQKYWYKNEKGAYSEMRLEDVPAYDNRTKLNYGKFINVPTTVYTIDGDTYHPYSVIKVHYGEVVGYRVTDLTFAGELVGTIGQSITSAVLDKITAQLGNFEYFYDLSGRFVFQRKKTYVQTLFNNLERNEDNELYGTNSMDTSSYVYSFENSNLITAFQNNPNLLNVKNDYAVWGTRTSKATGTEIPIHIRYALDKKPETYVTYEGRVITTLSEEEYLKDKLEKARKEKEEKLEALLKYKKTPNPNGLSEDWWEILDWAKYYELLTGSYPKHNLGTYANNGNGADGMEMLPLDEYFHQPVETYARYEVNGWNYYQNGPIYIFDVFFTSDDPRDSVIGYTGHGCGCGHSYDYFVQRALEGKGTSYIYKPIVPELEFKTALQQAISDLLVPGIVKASLYGTDWREIIYQMARDHSLYGHNDDFEAVIGANNPDTYPSGITGYEQYYTDIYSFWRDLYTPVMRHCNSFFNEYIPASQSGHNLELEWNELLEQHKLYVKDYDLYNYVEVTEDFCYDPKVDYYIQGGDSASLLEYPEKIWKYVADSTGAGHIEELTPESYIKSKETTDMKGFYNEENEYCYGYQTATPIQIKSTGLISTYETDIQYFRRQSEKDFVPIEKNDDGNLYFEVDGDYFVYMGYKAVNNFGFDKTYYVRYGTAASGYVYEAALYFNSMHVYTLPDGSVPRSFSLGSTYKDTTTGESITIHNRTYYELSGEYGYVQVYSASTLPQAQYYYIKDDGEQSELYTNKIVVGKINHYYEEYDPLKGLAIEMKTLLKVKGTDEIKFGTIVGQYFPFGKKYYNAKTEQIQTLYWVFDRLYDNPGSEDKTISKAYITGNYAPTGWAIDLDRPEVLNFWFDFLDTDGELSQYSVPKIGIRPKTDNKGKVKAIYYRETPTVIFVDPDEDITEEKKLKPGYTFLRCPTHLEQLFTISAQGKSAHDQLNDLLYQHTYCTETITLTTLPIYNLQPNTRIFVHDEKSGINGEYIVTKLTVPLAYNGTMSITATKAVENMF